MIDGLLEKWDNFIYNLSWKACNRHLNRYAGIKYFIMLKLQDETKDISPDLKNSAEQFYNAVMEEKNEH